MIRPLVASLLLAVSCAAFGLDGIEERVISPARYADAREALQDAIEGEGLVPSPPSRFSDMLSRTGPALGEGAPVYSDAEVLHFCSARVAWQLSHEHPLNAAQCPMSMAIYSLRSEPNVVHLAWRTTLGNTPGSRAADALLARIAKVTIENTGAPSDR